jgi:hypothetical protein
MRLAARIAAAAAVALAGAAAPRAGALTWTGLVGADYQRLDTQSPTGAASFPRLDLNLNLDASGFTPDVASWTAGVGYRRLTASQNGVDGVRDEVTYQLRSALFTNPRSAVNVDLNALRSTQNDSSEGVSATHYLVTNYGGELRLNAIERPFLVAGYNFSGSTADNPLLGTIEHDIQTVNATVGHGSSSYTYRGSYRLNRSEGTYALDRYDDQRVDVLADALVSDASKLSLTDTYYVRTPRDETTPSPRVETNQLLATYRANHGALDAETVTYSYARGVRTFEGTPDVERSAHSLALMADRGLSETDWRFRGTLQLSYDDDRIGGVPERTAGETLTVLTFWRREQKGGSRTELHAGPTVGLLQPPQGSSRAGWGGTGGGYVNRELGSVQAFASYDFTYLRDVNAEAGWTMTQTALGTASGRIALGTLRGTVQLMAQRRDSPIFGGSAIRTVNALSSYSWSTYELSLQATLQDGADGTVAGTKDGLFLPPGYDTHQRSVIFGAATTPWRFLALRARVRYGLTDLPDRPSLDEKEAYGAIEYLYGALRFGIEDRYVVAAVPGGQTRFNQVFVRAYRSFGSRF